MSRRFMASLLGGALLLGGTAGCGIPDRSEVRVDGPGPVAEAGSTSGGGSEPPNRATADTEQEFVTNFLSAAAGEPDRAYERVRQYIAPQDRSRLQEKQGSEFALTVVRLTGKPIIATGPDDTTVTIKVQHVGQLRADGVLTPPEATTTEYTFQLRTAAQESGDETDWYVVAPPNVLLLSVNALGDYYESRTIYFWSSDRSRLVPDLRYLPRVVPDERQVSEVVKWLTAGPSDWLRRGASGLPDRTQLINNATRTDDRWEVNLDMPGDDRTRLDQLGTQLAWSLPDLDGQLELKIRNQSRLVIRDLEQRRQATPIYALDQSVRRFCVYEGAVHPLSYPGETNGGVPVAPKENTDVVAAGFSRSRGGAIQAALVVSGSNGRQRLSVGTGVEPVTAFFDSGGKGYTAMSRPIWLRSADPRAPVGLVVADGKLYRFDGRAQLSQVQLGLSGTVTAVAASLDGHRLAVLVGGALHVVAVNLDGGVFTTGPARRVLTSLTGLSAVDWYGENSLIVARSSADRSAIYQISVDGALETAIGEDILAPRVTHLAAYPARPGQSFGMAMLEANGVAYRTSPYERIQREQVQDVTPPPAGVRAGNPTAPFFLY